MVMQERLEERIEPDRLAELLRTSLVSFRSSPGNICPQHGKLSSDQVVFVLDGHAFCPVCLAAFLIEHIGELKVAAREGDGELTIRHTSA